MQAVPSQPSDKERILIIGKNVGEFIFSMAKGTFRLGQELRGLVDTVTQQSKLIEELQMRSVEINELKQKLATLETGVAEVEALKTQLYGHHCRMVLLESGRKLIQSRVR